MTKTVSFDDVVDFQEGPGILAKDFHDTGVPLIRLKGMEKPIATLDGCNYLDPEKVKKKWSHFTLKSGDLLLSTSGTLGRVSEVDDSTEGSIAYTGIIRFRPKDENVLDRLFLKHFLSSNVFKAQAQSVASGSVLRHFGPSHLKKMEILLPDIKSQRNIGKFLDDIDQKIELNQRMNETLEQMGQALFKRYFIDNPEAEKWNKVSIYNFADVVYGAPFSSELFNEDYQGRPLIRIRDLKTQEPGFWTTEKHPKGALVKPGDIVVGMDAEFQPVVWASNTAWMNQRVCKFAPKHGTSHAFILEAIKPWLNFFEREKTGTTVIHLGKSDIDTFSIKNPDKKTLNEFTRLASPLYSLCIKNSLNIRALSALRDSLLPRLISGKIEV